MSAERGQLLITICGTGNAIENFIPPVFTFPRARFYDTLIKRGPPGCIGYAKSPTSGWMTGPLFLKVLEHIKKLVPLDGQLMVPPSKNYLSLRMIGLYAIQGKQ